MNQGLMIISPVILVRLLTVEEFGRYREFLLYVSLLTSICAFGFSSSLLYFIPARPRDVRQVLRQTLTLTAIASFAVVCLAVVLNDAFDRQLVGEFAWPVAIYVMLFVNLDFWESYWLANRRPLPVWGYTTGRLVARMIVVIVAAALTHSVDAIIWSLVALEAARMVGSFIAWRRLDFATAAPSQSCWREQLRYCLPIGGAMVLVTFNKSLGNLFVAKALGAVALAHYTIGTHVQPIITVLRNSLSDALLPDMAAVTKSPRDALPPWRRMTVVSMMLLVGAGVVLARYAHPIVVTLFSRSYEPAVPIFQIYVLVLVREIFDFGVALRAINRTSPIIYSNLFAILLNLACLALLLPVVGLIGAVIAFVISRYVEGLWLGYRTLKEYQVPLRELASWGDLAKVAMAATLASPVLFGSYWTDWLGFAGVIVGSIVYLALFGVALLLLRVPEAALIVQRIRNTHRPAVQKS
jgi:O-antigen/teichoic acid export membrane protein